MDVRAPRDTGRFRELTRQLLDHGLAVRFRAAGTSMGPAIADGDAITVAPVPVGEIARGDIVFYACGTRTIAHRVVEIRSSESSAPTFIVRGDAKGECDAPVAASQVLGKVVAVERGKGESRPRRAWRRAMRALLILARSRRRPQPADTAADDSPQI